MTGRKAEQKQYFRHTGYMGHERFTPYATMLAKHPERVIEKAVYGMLPKTALGRQVAAPQAPRVCRRRASARRAAADGADLHARRGEVTMADTTIHAIGRRKEAVCRVYLSPGSGKWDVNGRTLGDYFPRPTLVSAIQQPFTATDTLGRFDVKAHLDGGGISRARPARCASPSLARS